MKDAARTALELAAVFAVVAAHDCVMVATLRPRDVAFFKVVHMLRTLPGGAP